MTDQDLAGTAFDALRANFHGELLSPGSRDYDQARVVWNKRVDSYGARKMTRLANLKREFDPTNLFHLNKNIEP